MPLYNFDAARVDSQREMMIDLDNRGICVFCPEHIEKEDFSPLIIDTDHWMVKQNSFPYKNTKHHLLAIPKEHVATITNLSKEAQTQLFEVVSEVVEKLGLDSYAILFRSGDMRKNGGSIEHLHGHIIVGDTDAPDHQPVKVKVSNPFKEN